MPETGLTFPGQIIGYRKNGLPIRLMAGASGEEEGATPEVTPENDDDPAQTEDAQPEEPEKDWRAEAEKWKKLSRKNETNARDNARKLGELESQTTKQAELLKTLAEKAGVSLEEEKPEVRISKIEDERRQLAIENAVIRKAVAAGADPDALLDSRSFVNGLRDLDPSSGSFTADVEAAIQEAVENNSRYRSKTEPKKPAVKQAGADFRGAPVTERQWTREDAMNASTEELNAAMEKGLLKNLGFGPSKGSQKQQFGQRSRGRGNR